MGAQWGGVCLEWCRGTRGAAALLLTPRRCTQPPPCRRQQRAPRSPACDGSEITHAPPPGPASPPVAPARLSHLEEGRGRELGARRARQRLLAGQHGRRQHRVQEVVVQQAQVGGEELHGRAGVGGRRQRASRAGEAGAGAGRQRLRAGCAAHIAGGAARVQQAKGLRGRQRSRHAVLLLQHGRRILRRRRRLGRRAPRARRARLGGRRRATAHRAHAVPGLPQPGQLGRQLLLAQVVLLHHRLARRAGHAGAFV